MPTPNAAAHAPATTARAAVPARPALEPRPAAAAMGRPRSEDLKSAMSDAVVRDAMELFEGQLVNVRRMEVN